MKGSKIIMDGRKLGISARLQWRRGIIIDGPEEQFGAKKVRVRLERRGRELACDVTWQPVAWCLVRSDLIESALNAKGLLHGHDDAGDGAAA
jgi:hypothetical protein